MNDRHVEWTYTGLLATLLGVAAFVLAGACFVVDSLAVGFLSIHFGIGSALFRVRSWFVLVVDREKRAFELGQEAARLYSLPEASGN